MAWNPDPKVVDARAIAKRWQCDQVIIIAISQKRGTMQMATYGATSALCDDTKQLGDTAYAAIYQALEEG